MIDILKLVSHCVDRLSYSELQAEPQNCVKVVFVKVLNKSISFVSTSAARRLPVLLVGGEDQFTSFLN